MSAARGGAELERVMAVSYCSRETRYPGVGPRRPLVFGFTNTLRLLLSHRRHSPLQTLGPRMPLPKRAVPFAACAALLAALGACGGNEPQPIPAQVSLNTSTVALTALGQQQQLSASITDQDGNTLPPETASWSTSNPCSCHRNLDGPGHRGQGLGSAQITAAAGSASASAQVSVVQTPVEIEKVSGDAQTASPGSTLPAPLVVRVEDSRGNVIVDLPVTFTVSQGEGNVSTVSATTSANGTAATTFTTGTDIGSPQEVLVTVPSTTISTSFSAILPTDPTSFDIGIRYVGTATSAQRQAFAAARLRWEEAVTGDLEDGLLEAAAGDCGTGLPGVNQNVDDVLILVQPGSH